MTRVSDPLDSEDHPAPLSQKQEDVLLELFLQLSVTDRKRVIKFCRDLVKAASDPGK